VPELAGSGKVVKLTINDQSQTIPPDDNQKIDLGPLGSLTLNEVDTSTPGTLVRRALHLQSPLGEVVIAEARAGSSGAPCAKPGSGVSPGSATGGRGTARLVVGPPAAASRIARGRCVNGAFRATVKGKRISRVAFSVDGRTVKTDRKAPYDVRIRAAVGRHRLRARVTFTKASGTAPRTLGLRFARCAPAAPTFTG
jgi:hypothetical protein